MIRSLDADVELALCNCTDGCVGLHRLRTHVGAAMFLPLILSWWWLAFFSFPTIQFASGLSLFVQLLVNFRITSLVYEASFSMMGIVSALRLMINIRKTFDSKKWATDNTQHGRSWKTWWIINVSAGETFMGTGGGIATKESLVCNYKICRMTCSKWAYMEKGSSFGRWKRISD